MNILFLTLRADFGGGPEHLWQLLRNLPPDLRACVACPEDYPYYERYCACVGKENVFILPHRAFSPGRLRRLRIFCRERNVAVLHSHGKGAGAYARPLAALTGLPCFHTFHGVHMGQYGLLQRAAYRLVEKVLALFTQGGIAVSGGEREQVLAEGLMPEGKLHLIENGVSVPEVSATPPNGPPYRVVSMSRFEANKNSPFLVEILDALRRRGRMDDFRFTVLGEGPGKSAVEALARDRGVSASLECAGATREPQVFFEGTLCCLSTSRWEGMPLAVLEGMAYGLPVVATDVVGNRDVVADGRTGFLYAEGDADAAAAALIRLADDGGLRNALGCAARMFVNDKHDVRDMAGKTFSLLRTAVRGS